PAQPAARSTDASSGLAHANTRLASHQRVSSASWWPDADFPRTSTLKVRRHLLPAPADMPAGTGGAPPAEAVANVARVSSVTDDQTLGQLGLDSLGLVELVAQIEDKTGRALPESA